MLKSLDRSFFLLESIHTNFFTNDNQPFNKGEDQLAIVKRISDNYCLLLLFNHHFLLTTIYLLLATVHSPSLLAGPAPDRLRSPLATVHAAHRILNGKP